MTTPDPDEALAPEAAIEPLKKPERAENPIVSWARAIALGIGDTAKDVLDEGRRGARQGMEEGWERFDEKTKNRRKRDGR